MKEGAFDYVEKPFDNEELKALIRRALDVTRLARENRYLRAELQSRYTLDAVVAESAAMRAVLDLVRRAARSPSTVLISGENGTGKELIACPPGDQKISIRLRAHTPADRGAAGVPAHPASGAHQRR